MLEKFKYLLLICFVHIGCFAQTDEVKYWDDGKLEWSDFRGKVPFDQADNVLVEEFGLSELNYYIGYETERYYKDGVSYIRYMTVCYIDSQKSWVTDAGESEENVIYNQLIFDIVELHRRKIQYSLDRVNSPIKGRKLYQRILKKCKAKIKLFISETKRGSDEAEMKNWKQNIAVQLNRLGDQIELDYEEILIGYSPSIEIGTILMAGELSDHFSTCLVYKFGLDFRVKKHTFNGVFGLSRINIQKDIPNKPVLKANRDLPMSLFNFSYGYSFLQSSKYSLTPFVGVGYLSMELSDTVITSGVSADVTESFSNFNFVTGLRFEYKVSKSVRLTPNRIFGVKEAFTTKLFANAFMTKADLDDNLNGYMINLTFGVRILWNKVKVVRSYD